MEADETDFETLIETAIEAGVLTETDNERLQWTNQLIEARESALERLDDATYEQTHREYIGRPPEQESMGTRDILASAVAVREIVPGIERDRALLLAEAYARFERDEPTKGVPDGFVPIAGDEIDTFLSEHPITILYFWREECSPCRLVRERLEHILETEAVPDHVGTAAIYGPSYAIQLREQYHVTLAPTVLFASGSTIDTRHIGETYEEVLRNEIDIITEKNGP